MTNNSTTLKEILDWQVRLTVKQAILQNVSETKEIHITGEMIEEAKGAALADLEALLLKEVIGEDDNKRIVFYGKNMKGDINTYYQSSEADLIRADMRTALSKLIKGE